VNCSEKLNRGLKILRDDPYLAIGVENGLDATESEIKKGYRKFALKYHPDKTQNRTGLLFTVIQAAYDRLSDEEKRQAHDSRVKKQQAKSEKMRAAKEASEKRKAEKASDSKKSDPNLDSEGNLKPASSSTNSFRQPPQSKDEASYRAFNKKFFDEFKKKNRDPPSNPPPKGKPPPVNAHSSPPKGKAGKDRVRLKATHRSDTTVTLAWAMAGAKADSTAYELQWCVHGLKDSEWETSAQLILGNSCRKKNLTAGTCYAFRVRGAASSGWTPYSESVMVVTNNNHSSKARPSSAGASRSAPSDASQKKKAPPPKDMFKQNFRSVDAWACSICKRPNAPDAQQCSICYTKRSYVGKNDGTGSTGGSGKKNPSTARPSTAGATRSKNDRGYFSEGFRKADSDEEYGEGAWDFVADTDFDESVDRRTFELGDIIMTDGLSSVEYNGLMGEVKSVLTDGRHQVQLKLSTNELKDLRLRPDHLLLKKRRIPKAGRKNANNRNHSQSTKEDPTPQPREAFNGDASSRSQSNSGGGGGGGDLGGREYRSGFPKIYYLDTNHTKLHNVRAEPIKESQAIGSLLADRQVLALAEVGDWLKVEWHIQTDGGKSSGSFGWCLYRDSNSGVHFLREDTDGGVFGSATPHDTGWSDSDGGAGWSEGETFRDPSTCRSHGGGEEAEEVIYELRDASGDLYYFNGYTGVSCWDPPEWIDSIDPLSGACYYENTVTGATQWETPFDFIPVVTETLAIYNPHIIITNSSLFWN